MLIISKNKLPKAKISSQAFGSKVGKNCISKRKNFSEEVVKSKTTKINGKIIFLYNNQKAKAHIDNSFLSYNEAQKVIFYKIKARVNRDK